jgi:hypothetical protein
MLYRRGHANAEEVTVAFNENVFAAYLAALAT